MSEHDNPYSLGDSVIVTIHDWQLGEIKLAGRVVAIQSPARCQVEIDGNRYSVLVEDMELGCAATLAHGRAA